MNRLLPTLLAGALLTLVTGVTAAAPDGNDVGAAVARSDQPGPEVMRKWSRSCALCHVDGNAGAPRVGNAEEWQPRLAQGPDVLFDHTINGFNKMPPLGYCMSCEAADFQALIDFMAGAPE